jgi:hypothetical protein
VVSSGELSVNRLKCFYFGFFEISKIALVNAGAISTFAQAFFVTVSYLY